MTHDYVNEFLAANEGRRLMILKDGTELSVQASEGHYCSPRSNVGPYGAVEVAAFVRRRPGLIAAWGEPSDASFHGGLWGFLSVAKINAEIERRGGLAS